MPTAAAPTNQALLNEDEVLTQEDQQAIASEAEPAAPSPPQAPPAEEALPPQVLPAGQPGQQPPKTKKTPEQAIPYERFREVNEESKRKDRELSEMREKWARLEERSRLAQEAQANFERQQQTDAEKAKIPTKPDETLDPYGAQLWERDRKIDQLTQSLQEVRQNLGQTSQQVQQSANLSDFNLWLTNDINSYRQRQPDYEQAAQHARQARVTFWQSVGLPPDQAEVIVNNEALAVAYAARQNGKSAAQAYYDAARTMGYQGAAPTPEAAAAAAPPSSQEKLAQLRKGQAAQGLSRAPILDDSNANWSALSAQQIADMDENDFVEALQDPQRAIQINKALERLEGVRQ
jgi:hypothetical protein